MANANSNKPAKVFRLRGISASVFLNSSGEGDESKSWHKVSIVRTYRQGEEFRTTNSFSRDDLPIVKLLSDQAWRFILAAEYEDASGESD